MLKSLAMLGLLLAIAPKMSSQPHKAIDHKEQIGQNANPAPAGANGVDKETKSQANQPKPNPDPPEWYASLERPDWRLVILGFGTLVIVGWQTKILGESVGAAQTAADAAEISAKAAMGMSIPHVVLAKFSFVISRGRIRPEEFYQQPHAKVVLKNYGQSPAILKQYGVAFSLREGPTEFRDYYFDAEEIIDPGGTSTVDESTLNDSLPAKSVDQLVNGRNKLIFSFWVTYRDVFGSPVHTYRFEKHLAEFDPNPAKMCVVDFENVDLIPESAPCQSLTTADHRPDCQAQQRPEKAN